MSSCLPPLVRTRHLHRLLPRAFSFHLPCPSQSPFPAPPHLPLLPNTSKTSPQPVSLPGFTLSSNAFSSACALERSSLSLGHGSVENSKELVSDGRRPSSPPTVRAFCTKGFTSVPSLDALGASDSTETVIPESERFLRDLCPEGSSVRKGCGRLSGIVQKALLPDCNDSTECGTERALINKIQSLKRLGFTESQILKAVENLSVNLVDITTFVQLPVERLSSVHQFLINLGLHQKQSRQLLEQVPAIFLRDKEHLESTGRAWERLLDGSLLLIRSVRFWPEMLLVSEPEIEESSEYLQSKVGSKETLCTLLRNNPTAVRYSKDVMERAAETLLELGIKEPQVGSILTTRPFLLEGHPPQIVRSAEFLRGQGLKDEVICKILLSCAKVLRSGATMRLSQSLQALERHGFTVDEVNKYISSKPGILRLPVSRILEHNKAVLMKLGFQEDSPTMKNALRQSFGRNVNDRIKVFVDAGIEHGTACKMFMDYPFLISSSTNELRTKVDFLLNTMYRTIEEIVSCPTFFSCGLETKIKPRLRVITWLRSIGELQEDVPLSTYVSVLKEDFFEQFVNRHPEGPAIYDGEVQEAAARGESC